MDERDQRGGRGGQGLPGGLTADIAAIAAVMAEHGLRQVEIEANGIRVNLMSGMAVPTVTATNGAIGINSATSTDESVPVAVPAPAIEAEPTSYIFRSPMIGTFYAASGPSEEPFVRVGERVIAGQTVALIEAMKINNEIGIDRNGTVEEIYVSNGQPVEYNQPLLRLAVG